ncbi:hypothetical protein D3C78_20340 [compost metagenome]
MKETVITKDRYVSTIEVTSVEGRNLRELEILIDTGRVPDIGDFKQAICSFLGFEPELRSIQPLEFAARLIDPTPIRQVRIMRTFRDNTYAPVTKV